MPTYQYTAVDVQGHTLRGQMEASSETALDNLLRKRGQWLAEARERATATSPRPKARGNIPISRRMLIEFFLQTSLQLKSGISLVDALRFGLQDQPHAGLRSVQKAVLDRVEAGASFSEALAAHPRTFAPMIISLVCAGETSGRLSEMCSDIRRYFEWVDRLMADIRQALLYPAFVLMAVVLFFFLVFTFLIPRFAAVLTEIKVPLPMITRIFLDISAFMTAHGWVVGGGMILAGLGLKFGPRLSVRVACLFDHIKLSLPIFGPIHHLICLSRLAQNLATLYRAGIPLLQALKLAARWSVTKYSRPPSVKSKPPSMPDAR